MIKATIIGLAALLFLVTISVARGQTTSPTTSPTVSPSPTETITPSPTSGRGGTTIPSGAPATGFGR